MAKGIEDFEARASFSCRARASSGSCSRPTGQSAGIPCAGSVTRLTFPADTLEEYANVIAHRLGTANITAGGSYTCGGSWRSEVVGRNGSGVEKPLGDQLIDLRDAGGLRQLSAYTVWFGEAYRSSSSRQAAL
jgi:hypothetical protein